MSVIVNKKRTIDDSGWVQIKPPLNCLYARLRVLTGGGGGLLLRTDDADDETEQAFAAGDEDVWRASFASGSLLFLVKASSNTPANILLTFVSN